VLPPATGWLREAKAPLFPHSRFARASSSFGGVEKTANDRGRMGSAGRELPVEMPRPKSFGTRYRAYRARRNRVAHARRNHNNRSEAFRGDYGFANHEECPTGPRLTEHKAEIQCIVKCARGGGQGWSGSPLGKKKTRTRQSRRISSAQTRNCSRGVGGKTSTTDREGRSIYFKLPRMDLHWWGGGGVGGGSSSSQKCGNVADCCLRQTFHCEKPWRNRGGVAILVWSKIEEGGAHGSGWGGVCRLASAGPRKPKAGLMQVNSPSAAVAPRRRVLVEFSRPATAKCDINTTLPQQVVFFWCRVF
jgi:hypothetical protein